MITTNREVAEPHTISPFHSFGCILVYFLYFSVVVGNVLSTILYVFIYQPTFRSPVPATHDLIYAYSQRLPLSLPLPFSFSHFHDDEMTKKMPSRTKRKGRSKRRRAKEREEEHSGVTCSPEGIGEEETD